MYKHIHLTLADHLNRTRENSSQKKATIPERNATGSSLSRRNNDYKTNSASGKIVIKTSRQPSNPKRNE